MIPYRPSTVNFGPYASTSGAVCVVGIELQPGHAEMPSLRWYPHPSKGWGESLLSPTRSAGTLSDSYQALLGCHPWDGILTHPWDGGDLWGKRSLSTTPLKMLIYRVLFFKNSIHWIKWCGLRLHILRWKRSSRRANFFENYRSEVSNLPLWHSNTMLDS